MSKKTLTGSITHEWNQANGSAKGNVEIWPNKGHVQVVLHEYIPTVTTINKWKTHNNDSPDVSAHEKFNTNTKNHWLIVVTALSNPPGAEVQYELEAPGL